MVRNAVIFHHPDGVETNRTDLMGRHAAGEGFLRGFVTHGKVDEFFAHTMSPDHFADFASRIRQIAGNARPCRRVGHDTIGQNDVPGVLSLPGPDLAPLAWRRRMHGNAAYSLCGLNHTVASERVMSRLGGLLTAPVQPWDALICTSRSSKSAIRHVIDGYAEYLEERIGTRPPLDLLMPVIPLGVDCAAFAQDAKASADRAQLRQGLGIEADDVALLFVGRLSFHAKAHPLPFYIAAEAAARHTGRRVHLIQAGWFANEGIEKEFRDGARTLCPSVNAIFLDGRDQDVRRRIWRAADVFVSLSDNIQETFGLTPIEAMAAGLPVVVSDWNGYRETVSDGEHGFTVPTWMPAAGDGRDFAFAPELELLGSTDDIAYDRYCGVVSQSTVVDTGACIDALSVLCADADKRRVMGEAGRHHARGNFDWSVVVKAYQDVWEELDSRRARAAKEARHLRPAPDVPLRCDPFAMFEAYPTFVISDTTEVHLIDGADVALLNDRLSASMNNFGAKHLLNRDEMAQVVGILKERGVASTQELVDEFGPAHRSKVLLSIGWLSKMYLVRLVSGAGATLDFAGHDGFAESPEGQGGRSAFDDDALDMIEPENAFEAKPDTPIGGVATSPVTSELLEQLAEVPVSELLARTAAARAEGDVKMAAACLHRASALMPGDPDINVQMGELLASGERYDAAIACLRRAVQDKPDHLSAHRNLGKALFLRGDEAEGIHSFRRAVRLAPEDGEARLLLGTALRRAGAVNEALQCLRIAVEIDPERAEAGYHLGLVCRAMKRTDDAIATFERVLSHDPNNRFAQAAIMSIEAESGGPVVSDGQGVRRIALHMSNQADFFALAPIFDALREDQQPLFSADLREISEFRPDAILTTTDRVDRLRDRMPTCSIVQIPRAAIRHPGSILHSASADAIGVVTEDEQNVFLEAGVAKANVWLTGLPLMDPVFSGKVRRRQSEDTGRGRRRQVLYMPDWRPGISAAPAMNAMLAALCDAGDGGVDIAVRPDPVTLERQPGWVEAWINLAASYENLSVHTAEGVDFLSLMAEAELLISDYSSTACTFLAFDAPLVLIRPADDTSPRYRISQKHVEMLESVATCIDGRDDVVPQIIKTLDDPNHDDESRARARSQVFGGGADGRAAIRTVSAFYDLMGA